MAGSKKKSTKTKKSTQKSAQKTAQKKPTSRAHSKIGSALTILAVVLAFAFAALLVIYPSRPFSGGGRVIAIELTGNETAEALADRLAELGVVRTPRLFAAFIKTHGVAGKIAPGVHLFTDALSPNEVLARIERFGAGARTKVTIPEGWNRFDIARRLENKGICAAHEFLAATENQRLLNTFHIEALSFEGYLFPATYDLPADSAPSAVVQSMKLEFDRRYATMEDRHASGVLDLADSLHFSEREIVTLASMVEKEAAVDDERAIIAGVFLNRLRDPKFSPKLLQCDPTAGYGCVALAPPPASCASFTGKITHEIVADPDNMYNTYKHEGLPPGPISNPGAKSIEAVMDATPSHYFYFVAKGGGRHTFSETYAAHAAAIESKRDE